MMASLTITANADEFKAALAEMNEAVMSCKKVLPGHVRCRLYSLVDDASLAADMDYESGHVTVHPSAEFLSVLALCRYHARAT